MELRKDYILDWYVIFAKQRASRPDEFKHQSHSATFQDVKDSSCVFCPGNEQSTSQDAGEIGNPWRIRWFPNKYAIAVPEGNPIIRTDNTFFTFSEAFGYHEVVVDTNLHNKQIYDFDVREIKEVFETYKNRLRALSSKAGIRYVLVFKNHGKDAGASINHSHSQILALNHIPEHIGHELRAINDYDSCPYCNIISAEINGDRRCLENSHFVAFTPYASRFSYEIWIFPKQHVLSITQLDDMQMESLARIMRDVFSRIKLLGVAFNMFIHNSPEEFTVALPFGQKHGLHFQIEITPRINVWGGLEEGGGTYVNTVLPEEAAKFYRGEEKS